jgi:hypothetical protein
LLRYLPAVRLRRVVGKRSTRGEKVLAMLRRNNPDMHDPSDERNDRPKRRRDGRGLGPFSSGHLTIIAVTLLILVAFPFAAFAVTGSNVFVTDPSSGNQAQVAGGKLKVDTGIGTFLGIVPVSPVGPQKYPTSDIIHTDDGTGSDYVYADECGSGTCATLLKPPAGKAAVVTAIHINTFKVTATGSTRWVEIVRSSDGSCSTSSTDRAVEFFNPSGIGETQLQYDMPGGLSVPAGKALCVINSDLTNLGFALSARGYAVASNVVPASAAPADAPKGAALLKPQQ